MSTPSSRSEPDRLTLHINEALNSLHEDTETKSEKESGVEECSKYFCTMPAVGIGSRGILSCKLVENALSSSSVKSRTVPTHLDGVQSHDETHNITIPGVSVGKDRKIAQAYLSIWKESATRASEPTA